MLFRSFDEVEFLQVLRNQNALADEISKLASSEEGGLSKNLTMEIQKIPASKKFPHL